MIKSKQKSKPLGKFIGVTVLWVVGVFLVGFLLVQFIWYGIVPVVNWFAAFLSAPTPFKVGLLLGVILALFVLFGQIGDRKKGIQ